MLVENGKITAIGSYDQIAASRSISDVQTRDLKLQTVLPGFIDGHMHLLLLGQSLRKLELRNCKSLEDIKTTIKEYALAHPNVPRIQCKNWMHVMTPKGRRPCWMILILDQYLLMRARSIHAGAIVRL
jgi:predicted amidohydrolase YtcJ